ncbi:MAG TPA: ABC transporter permease, partial [Bryobacteraceae bacterium]|nr:ABC transporter permease [Bryobacteraceae bacterium]
VRTLRGSPAFSVAAVLTLALGIGANTALFTIIDSVLLRPLPYPDPSRIVVVDGQSDGGPGTLAPADFLDYRAQSHAFENLAAYRETALNLTGRDQSQRIIGAIVTPDFFAVMRVPAELGRTFLSQVDRPGAGRLIVLGDTLWRQYYGADPNILGKSVEIEGEPHTVIGVMPPYFRFPDQSVAWTLSHYAVPEHALRPQIDQSRFRDTHYFEVIGRLAASVSLQQCRAEMNTIASRLKQQFAKDEEYDSALVIPLQDDLVGETKTALLILLASVTLLLLIACVNVANILLARGASRQKEIAIRSALGAGKWRIIRQLLTESLVVAACGGALGVLFAFGALIPLRSWMPPEMLAGAAPHADLRVLAFTAITALGSGLFFGLFPALQMAKPDLNVALKESGRGSTGDRSSQRTRNLLVVSEIALATVLLIGAGLLIRSFSRVQAAPEGFHPENVLTLQTSLSAARYPDAAKRTAFVNQSLDRIRAVPGVVSASVISRLPLNHGRSTRGVMVKGHPPFDNDGADYLVISPDYFTAMGIGLNRGRTFTQRDDATVILNESAARRFFANEDPLGRFIRFDTNDPWLEVAGVVSDVRQHQLDQDAPPAVYVPYSHDAWPFMAFVVRMTPLGPSGIQAAIHQVDKDQPVYNIRPMQEVVSGSLSSRRFGMLLLGLFAVLALVLACVGIYGVIAYSVAQRASEIGIRLALGADPKAVLGMILSKGLRLAIAGVGLGVILSFGLTRFLANVLYGVRATDTVTFAGSSVLLIAVAVLASYVPAWRAAQVDPVIALRAD